MPKKHPNWEGVIPAKAIAIKFRISTYNTIDRFVCLWTDKHPLKNSSPSFNFQCYNAPCPTKENTVAAVKSEKEDLYAYVKK